MPTIDIPARLRDTRSRDDAGRAWLAGLPDLVADRLDAWDLHRDGDVMSGMGSLVLPVRTRTGEPAVLKLQPVDDETVGEPHGLRLWDGDGSVRLLDEEPATGALLLEALDPARPLSLLSDPMEALEILTGLLARLTAHAAPTGLRRLADIARAMVEQTPDALPLLTEPADRDLVSRCAATVDELAGEAGDRCLHWDLHYDNVLAPLPGSGREPWLAIDPKPLAGDPAFDLLPALWNRWDAITAAPDPRRAVRARFDLMTAGLGLDRDRATGWTLGRILQNTLWNVEDGEPAVSTEERLIADALLHR